MHTGHLARRDEVLQDTVRLDHDMFLIPYLDLFAYQRIDEGQFGQFAVEEVRQRFAHLLEGRFFDKHTMEDTVRRIGFGVLLDTAAGERSVTDIHGEEQVVDGLFAVHSQNHMLRLMLHDGTDETEDVVDMMTADIVLKGLRFLAAERIDTKTDGVDEIAVMLNAVPPISDTAYIDGMSFAFEETAEGLFKPLIQIPIAPPVVTCTAGHEAYLYLRALLRREISPHDTVDRFGERTITAENKDLVVPFLDQLTRQLNGVSCKFGNAIRKGHMPFAQ